MINLTEKAPDLIAMEIKMTIPQTEIFAFLQMKGYEIKAFTKIYEPTEEMLTSEPGFTYQTFTATKPGEEQSFKNHYLKVFEREINEFLKGFK
ncbi:hypothetical protein HER18_07520 [Chryseobacterium sp. NEB161]|nr:hypothetical protein HER18_07520 [Chryseobacterium sp. NEB161]